MRYVLLCLALVGCSSSPHGNCVERVGSYRVNYVARSGTCGAIPEQVVVFGGSTQMMQASLCRGEQRISGDQCDVTSDITCDIAGQPGTVRIAGTIHWSDSGASGGGILQTTVSQPPCSSTYDVTYTKL